MKRSNLNAIILRWLVFSVLLFAGTLACDSKPDPSCIQCKYGEEKCSFDQKGLMLCQQNLSTGCWQFILKRCDKGLVCVKPTTPGGRITCQLPSQGCPTQCTEGTKKCEGETVVSCKFDITTNCAQWFPETTCPAGTPCQNGSCGGSSCTPKQPQAQKKCDGNAVYWFDDCGNKGALVQQCQAGQTCQNGACSGGGCQPTDPLFKKKCVGNSVYWFDDCDKQRDLVEACGAGKTCQNGVCAEAPCSGGTNQCSVGATQCSGNAVQICIKNSVTNCTEWGSPAPCVSGQTCQNGNCVPGGGGNNGNCKKLGSSCKSSSECCNGMKCKEIIPIILSLCSPI